MRISRTPRLKFVACLAVLAFLLGSVIASAAGRDERMSKEPRTAQKPVKAESIFTGPYKGEPHFFKEFLQERQISDCSSSCCTAHASCNGIATTSCSASSCTASCSSGTSSTYTC
jgi:hypothetical protein